MLTRILVLFGLLGIVAAGIWWFNQQSRPAPADESLPIVLPRSSEAPPVRHPVPEPEIPRPPELSPEITPEPLPVLPALEDSDEFVLDGLRELFGEDILERWLVEERIVERTVVFINSLDSTAIPLRMRPLQPVPGVPIVREADDSLYWDPDNRQRFAPLVETLETSDPEVLAQVYIRHYPLFQQAHEDLAFTDGYFNDRLVDVIDHLLAGPIAEGELAVELYESHYRFADPGMETQSWGRKILLRMGPDQAEAVKAWLREFRAHIVSE